MITNRYKSASIHTNQTLLSSNRLELSPWSFTHVLKKIDTTTRWNCKSKVLRFLQITAEHQDCPFFTVFLTIKTLSQNISIQHSYRFRLNLTNIEAAIGGKSSRERFWKNSSQCREILLQVKYLIALFRCYDNSKCHCNPDRDKLSSLSNTTLVAIFPNLIYGDVVYAQAWEVLTLKNCIEPPYDVFYTKGEK